MPLTRVELRGFRNIERAGVDLGASITVIHGANGAGKTNLLEAIHFALTGGSCRTRNDREMIAFGAPAARAEVTLENSDGRSRYTASIARSGERRIDCDGPAAASSERPPVGVFLPDRLVLIKGAPAERRTHLDRLVAAIWPARAELRRRFGRALAQRNALLARIRSGDGDAQALAAWDGAFARQALAVIEARREATDAVTAPFAALSRELGLEPAAELRYRPRIDATSAEEIEAELAERRDEDLARGYSAHGPQADELVLEFGGRALRRYGSQGQQRLALLALLLAERQALIDRRDVVPLMLLDDVTSELDLEHRRLLVERLHGAGQAVITATEASQIPVQTGLQLVAAGELQQPQAPPASAAAA
ncbi:MAG: replication and repair protein RecF [Solirubrobacterales bacterium]|jgi:DNA replication and repair protein RecF|nr:replication and repair protein RecF [Solirubrobacterales bacterium]